MNIEYYKCSARSTLPKMKEPVSILLFLPEEQADGHSIKIELLAQLVFKIVFVRLLYVVRKITKECKGRHGSGKLRYKFDLDRVASYNGRTIVSNRF